MRVFALMFPCTSTKHLVSDLPSHSSTGIQHSRVSRRSTTTTNMKICIWTWLLLTAAAAASAAANLTFTRHQATEPNSVSSTTSTIKPHPSNPTLESPTVETTNLAINPQIGDHHDPTRYPLDASTAVTEKTPQTKTEAVETQTRAQEEPDAYLQIAFLVLGALLALASVVVAIFFGYKQLSFMRFQSSIDRNNVRDDGSGGVDLEMGAVVITDDSSDQVGTATDSPHPSVRPS